MAFGGYIVPRGPTGGETHGSVGLLKKALSLIGNGGKGIIWFEFGPEPNFPGKHEPGLTQSLLNFFRRIVFYMTLLTEFTLCYYAGNCWSAIAMREYREHGTSSMFKYIAEASRLIAGAEDILFPGAMATAQVAVLYPRSSYLWDREPDMVGGG
jgi:hypothetical protein